MSNSARWDSYFMSVAHRTAELSYANRLKVGAVAVRDRRIICVGFNGTPPGEDNKCEGDDGLTLPSVVHAEHNLVKFANKYNINLTGCVLYVTHSPCIQCAMHIYESRIDEVVYFTEYRSLDGISFLKNKNIKVRKHESQEA